MTDNVRVHSNNLDLRKEEYSLLVSRNVYNFLFGLIDKA